MKTTPWVIALFSVLSAEAQVKQPAIVSAELSSYTIVERGDHHRIWQSITTETDDSGKTLYRTNSFTELETGMNVRQPDGTYIEASDEIEITATGGIAQKTRHQVTFASDCNSSVAIDMLSVDGKRLQSKVLGLSYFDTATGQSVLIAELTNSLGRLMPSKNEVIYYDAFTDLKADVRYKNSKAGLEQDIILREMPASPTAYQLNPATTYLEVLTEFINPPTPEKQVRTVNGAIDEWLNFGDLQMGNGKVVAMGEASIEIPVTKQWGVLEGRTFLVERIPFKSVEPQLRALPPARTASIKGSPDGVLYTVSSKRLLPPVKLLRKPPQPMILASAPLSGNGLVLDYQTLSTTSNKVLQGDMTYYVSGTVNLSATTVIEGGAIIKYTNTSAAKINITGTVDFQTSAYRPAIFTSKDDDTVGGAISGSTGSPVKSTSNVYLQNGGSETITYKCLRMAYAGKGVKDSPDSVEVWHSQFLNCTTAIYDHSGAIVLKNVLFVKCGTCADTHDNVVAEHITANGCSSFASSHNNDGFATNSLFTATSLGAVNLYYSQNLSSSNGIYQTVGAGSHYLADNTYRNSGTTNINATLLSDVRQRTTYPPIELTTDFTVDTTLSPQAQRDIDTPDLGYHYDPLDYVVNGRTLTNATLTLTNGVALGIYGSYPSYGIQIRQGGNLVSKGGPINLNQIAGYNTVQEQANTNWLGTVTCVKVYGDPAPVPQGLFQFTRWSLLGGNTYHFYADSVQTGTTMQFTDCQFGPGFYYVFPCSSRLTNCLFDRTYVYLNDNNVAGYFAYNNFFRSGTLILEVSGGSCLFKDNLFDKTGISQNGTITHSNNAYISGSNRLTPTNSNDVVLTNAPIYLTSYLGKYYYPTNDGMLSLLINAGSRNATNAGLYHYTVLTSQVKETNTTVDIGFHYVATDANGVPIDTDGDGVPDYLEDRNGNGTLDSGETDWQTYNSPNGLSGGGGLQVFTPLK